MKVWALIPAYNEAKSIQPLIAELQHQGLSVLVIDDGSSDGTYRIASQTADKVIRNAGNMGKGRSLKEGIKYLLAHEQADYFLIMDGDGQHSPQDIEKFLEAAARGASFVVGNRMANPSGMPPVRVITNRFMSWLISRISAQYVPDTQCGFRLIKREVLEAVHIQTSKFEVESEILLQAARNQVKIESVPIRSIYSKETKSKINPVIDTIRFIRFLLSSSAHSRKGSVS
jgi:glycosyltransferase involved in cell wall biosynthesis